MQDAIAVLIDLAQRGEIDPWDVQVIEVIDRYLSKLPLDSNNEISGDTDLSESGQAFLWASMLVLLKADTLQQEAEEDPELIDEGEFEPGGEARLPLHLERHLRRRPAALPLKRRPVTLQELIDQLQQIAAQVAAQTPRYRQKHPRATRAQTVKAIAQLAHQENLTEMATELDLFLQKRWQNQLLSQESLNLEELISLWKSKSISSEANGSINQEESDWAKPSAKSDRTSGNAELRAAIHDKVGIFWALLLLSAQSKVELTQEEFYQDIQIRAFVQENNGNSSQKREQGTGNREQGTGNRE